MFNNIEDISLSTSFDGFYVIIALLISLALAIYYYKFTVPIISKSRKIVLTTLRSIILLLIVFAIFEPVVFVNKKFIIEPKTYIFLDNSTSMGNHDSLSTSVEYNNLRDEFEQKSQFYTFSKEVLKVQESESGIVLNGNATNFENIFDEVEAGPDNVSAILILSDGNINEGLNPHYRAEKLGIPIYTVALGDTTVEADVDLRKVLYNDYIYSGKETEIEAVILHTGVSNKQTFASLFESDKLIEQKSIELGSSGITKVKFNYTANEPGEKKLTIRINPVENEKLLDNNSSTFYLDILKSKLRVLIVSGKLSPDVGFLKKGMMVEENFDVQSLVEIGNNRFANTQSDFSLIDSADVLILHNFPTKETEPNFWAKVKSAISNNKPFLIFATQYLDFSKTASISNLLPFNLKELKSGSREAQVEITDPYSSLISGDLYDLSLWNSLPPVVQSESIFTPKPGAGVIAVSKIRNITTQAPLLVSIAKGKNRSIAIIAENVYRWKLRNVSNDNLFENFLSNSIKWLNLSNEIGRFSFKTNKKIFNLGEEVLFSSNVYDENLNPTEGAKVSVEIESQNYKTQLNLNSSTQPGIYEGELNQLPPGDYSFTAKSEFSGDEIGKQTGNFSVESVEIEALDTKADVAAMQLLSNISGGEYVYISDIDNIIQTIKEKIKPKSIIKREKSEFRLWSSEILLIFVIILFAIEWFIRKRTGLL
ncbi:MAG: hypothetical protein K9J12_18460 [Melioribacteraceae bacterium]|nr:hypothetical protein [Melioribacteraceae bacterium]MCF8431939.1 hypothetical protein [Melioribacteraceae bacterium]